MAVEPKRARVLEEPSPLDMIVDLVKDESELNDTKIELTELMHKQDSEPLCEPNQAGDKVKELPVTEDLTAALVPVKVEPVLVKAESAIKHEVKEEEEEMKKEEKRIDTRRQSWEPISPIVEDEIEEVNVQYILFDIQRFFSGGFISSNRQRRIPGGEGEIWKKERKEYGRGGITPPTSPNS